MSTRLNRRSYMRLIDEDISWVLTMPPTLERDHIVDVLRASVQHEFPESPRVSQEGGNQ